MRYLKSITFTALFIATMALATPKAEAAAYLGTGATGPDVTYVQSILKKLDYFHTYTTGYYGPITADAVMQFQRDFGIEQTGTVGPQTTEMLNNVVRMAHVVHGEARGESYEGQVAVAAVILNRVESAGFPNTIKEVIFQPNAFTAVYDGQYGLEPNRYAYLAVKDAFLGWDPSYGSVFYYNPKIATNDWIFTRTTVNHIGNHRFAY